MDFLRNIARAWLIRNIGTVRRSNTEVFLFLDGDPQDTSLPHIHLIYINENLIRAHFAKHLGGDQQGRMNYYQTVPFDGNGLNVVVTGLSNLLQTNYDFTATDLELGGNASGEIRRQPPPPQPPPPPPPPPPAPAGCRYGRACQGAACACQPAPVAAAAPALLTGSVNVICQHCGHPFTQSYRNQSRNRQLPARCPMCSQITSFTLGNRKRKCSSRKKKKYGATRRW